MNKLVKNQYSICRFCKAKIYTPYKLYICPVCRKKQDTGEYIPHVRKKNMEALAKTRMLNPKYMRGFKYVEAHVGDRVYRPFKPGWGTVKEISGIKVKIKWDTGGTRWYPSYKLAANPTPGKNPLAGLLATVGDAAITGAGLGIGFGVVNYVQKKLSKKSNPRRKK